MDKLEPGMEAQFDLNFTLEDLEKFDYIQADLKDLCSISTQELALPLPIVFCHSILVL